MSNHEKAAFIAETAAVTGDVSLEKDASVWYGASVRGDYASINVGEASNIQDNASIHVDHDAPVKIGKGVTVGHNAVIHGCTVEDDCLIGMGAIILNRAVIGKGSIIGAGALVTEGKVIPPGSLAVGSPAKVMRKVSEEELGRVRQNASSYVEMARRHEAGEF
jgi:carbonic anhydrase/acetyltransferase-like protein (isoleucine patch superfamily)